MSGSGLSSFRFTLVLLVSLVCSDTRAQRLSARTCTSSLAVSSSRAASASNSNALAACTAFCSTSNPQRGGILYAAYCGPTSLVGSPAYVATQTCGASAYFSNAQIISGGQTVVPTLTKTGSDIVTVPCSYAGTAITAAKLGLSSPGSTTPYYVNQQVIASSNGDFTTRYMDVDGATGVISTSRSQTPPADLTQTVAFTLVQRGTGVYSNTVTITFNFQSCVLQLNGPTGPINVCNQVTNPATPFSNLIFTVANAANVPTGVTLTCDVPSDLSGGGTPSTVINADAALGPGADGINAPTVVSDRTIDPCTNAPAAPEPNNNPLLVVSYQTQTSPPRGVCTYGPNPRNPNFVTGCQDLQFSVSPDPSTPSPYLTGTKTVTVCYTGAACSPPSPDTC